MFTLLDLFEKLSFVVTENMLCTFSVVVIFKFLLQIWMSPSPSSTVHLLEWPWDHQTTDLQRLYLSGVMLPGPVALLHISGTLLVRVTVLYVVPHRLSAVATCSHMMLDITRVWLLMELEILAMLAQRWMSLVSQLPSCMHIRLKPIYGFLTGAGMYAYPYGVPLANNSAIAWQGPYYTYFQLYTACPILYICLCN